jgi:hypothetical protein
MAMLGTIVIFGGGIIFLIVYKQYGWIISGIVHMGADLAIIVLI